jgi:hypothetical protein
LDGALALAANLTFNQASFRYAQAKSSAEHDEKDLFRQSKIHIFQWFFELFQGILFILGPNEPKTDKKIVFLQPFWCFNILYFHPP